MRTMFGRGLTTRVERFEVAWPKRYGLFADIGHRKKELYRKMQERKRK